jgi:hypothetical protein
MTTRQIIKEAIRDEMLNEKRIYHIHGILISTFKKFEGKKITKRMVTALKEILPGWCITLTFDYGQINIRLWEHNFEDRESYFLGYCTGDHGGIYRKGSPEESHSGFEYYSNRTGAACLIRIKRAEQMLADPHTLTAIAKKVNAYKKAKENLEAIRFDYRYRAWQRLGLD